jgi:hypothetical protein
MCSRILPVDENHDENDEASEKVGGVEDGGGALEEAVQEEDRAPSG